MAAAPLRHRIAAFLVVALTVAVMFIASQYVEGNRVVELLATVIAGLVAAALVGLVVALYSAERVAGEGRARSLVSSIAEAARLYFLPWRSK